MTVRSTSAALQAALVLALMGSAAPSRLWTFGRRFGDGGFSSHPRPAPAFVSAVSRLAGSTSQIAAAAAQLGEVEPTGFGGYVFGREGRVEADTEPVITDAPTESATSSSPTAMSMMVTSAGESSTSRTPTTSLAPNPDPTAVPTAGADPAAAAEAETTSQATAATTPKSASKGAALLFPDQLAPLSAKSGDVFVPECDGVPFMAASPDTGRCQFLMMRTDCPDGHWFILDRESRQAACRPLPCGAAQVLFDGQCREQDDPALCPQGMVVLVNEYGEASCDCAVTNVYWPPHDRCYPAFRQGPCGVGRYLTVTEHGAHCTPNLCVRDGAVFWNETRRCYRLQDETDSPCALGRLEVGVESLELECIEAEHFAIFDLPIVRCSKGSKLDYGGRCKRELYQKFRSSFSTGATRKTKCPEGFVAGASGRCLKAATEAPNLS